MDNKVNNQNNNETAAPTNKPSNNPLSAEEANIAENEPPTWGELIMMFQETAAELSNVCKAVEIIRSETEVRPKNHYIKSDEVRTLMGVSERTLYNYRKSNTILHVKMNGRYLYRRSHVMALLKAGFHQT